MNLRNIQEKIKKNKEKSVVLSGRIPKSYYNAFEFIAKISDSTTSELFKATIYECIEAYVNSDIKVPYDIAIEYLKRNKIGEYTIIPKLASIPYDERLEKIPLIILLNDIDFTLINEKNKDKFNAYIRYYNEICNEYNDENEVFEKYEEIYKNHIKEMEDYIKYEEIYKIFHSTENQSIDLKKSYEEIPNEYLYKLELSLKPFVLNEKGLQKYSNDEIVNFWKSKNIKKQINSIEEVQEYIEYLEKRNIEIKKEKEEKYEIMGLDKNVILSIFYDIESDPFGYKSERDKNITNDMILKYWKHYMHNIPYFKNKQINIETIKDYTILKLEGLVK